MKKLAFLVVLSLVAVACGGSDSNADEGNDDVATTEASDGTVAPSDDDEASVDTTTPTADDDPDGSATGGENVAIVTIGDQTWEFDANPEGPITDCDPDFFGAFWVIGEAEDGSSLNLLLPPEGDPNFDDPPSVRVADRATEADWTADVTLIETANYGDVLVEGDSQLDTYSVDGNTASGTATFVDENQIFAVLGGSTEAVEPMSGSFEVSCAG